MRLWGPSTKVPGLAPLLLAAALYWAPPRTPLTLCRVVQHPSLRLAWPDHRIISYLSRTNNPRITVCLLPSNNPWITIRPLLVHSLRVNTHPLCASSSQTVICLLFNNNPQINIRPLLIHSPQVNTRPLCVNSSQTVTHLPRLPWVLWVGTYGFNPQSNVRSLSTCNPRISIRLLHPCKTLLEGMCNFIS